MSQNNQSYKNLEIFKLFKELKERTVKPLFDLLLH